MKEKEKPKGKKLEKRAAAESMSWKQLLEKAGWAIALLIVAIIFIIASAAWFPSAPPKSFGDYFEQLNRSLSDGQEGQVIKPVPENVSSAEECSSWLLQGGERDSYSYVLTSSYPDENMSTTASIDSVFLGYINGYNVRETRMESTVRSDYGSFSSEATMRAYMDSEFKCVKVNVTTMVQGGAYSQESSCSQGQQGQVGRFNLCADTFVNIRNETVMVGAGNFQARVYQDSAANSTVWISDDANVPVKMESPDGLMELVEYSRG